MTVPGPEHPVTQLQAALGLITSGGNQKVSYLIMTVPWTYVVAIKIQRQRKHQKFEFGPFFEGLCPFPQQSRSLAGCFHLPYLCPEVRLLTVNTALQRDRLNLR